jgi:hypothetical protein
MIGGFPDEITTIGIPQPARARGKGATNDK